MNFALKPATSQIIFGVCLLLWILRCAECCPIKIAKEVTKSAFNFGQKKVNKQLYKISDKIHKPDEVAKRVSKIEAKMAADASRRAAAQAAEKAAKEASERAAREAAEAAKKAAEEALKASRDAAKAKNNRWG
ncbi:hypothetical protein BOX15_Mlig027090g1 [Macrostomum lignano]|uniref:Uncharacterized protein n=1 Tax=Macrostomum lignano TaxID=282301 RepID=A0A267GWK5_9PLAT|nr:hypothetical protein BOX15_Mlig027090g2 [Macrostomum lignano]PAA78408.1 hypothetical protein BOX15_Mlig027090g3 [Macrostomum lignano]PAA90413.1 hypothetical protein BOX15_Mlig027090g1 [Macrostomum lignano]